MPFVNSPNMGFPVPGIATEPGPQYATDINQALLTIDSHDHSPGQGIPIGSQGINLQTDLTFNGMNATTLRTVRFVSTTASSGTDVGCVYVKGVDLFYNDLNANVIRMTLNGGLATTGIFVGVISTTAIISSNAGVPASSGFIRMVNNSDFVSWRNAANSGDDKVYFDSSDVFQVVGTGIQSDTVKLRDAVGGKVVTHQAVSGSSAYNVVWPVNPPLAATSAMPLIMSTSGSLIAQRLVRYQLPSAGQQISNSCATFSTSNTSLTDVTNLSVTLTTTGRPVMVFLQPLNNSATGGIFQLSGTGSGVSGGIGFTRDVTDIVYFGLAASAPTNGAWPAGGFSFLDVPTAGSHTYKAQTKVDNATWTAFVRELTLVAYEL